MPSYRSCFYALLLLCTYSVFAQSEQPKIQIAFLADIHFQDLYGKLSDSDYSGVKNPVNGKYTLLRTMESQLHSTRLFNENYFALFAALDDIVARGIKIVALPGDYTDDGQPLHVRGLSKILEEYSKKYSIQFFITTGNHDPVGPFAQESGKDDFLGAEGQTQPIYSLFPKQLPQNSLPPVITKDISKFGYAAIMESLRRFGFFPKESDLFWATPFSDYDPENYTMELAQTSSLLKNRRYETAPGYQVPDASYVVEPVPGVWLLAIDGNSYPLVAKPNADAKDPTNYKGADLGYNNLPLKKHLLPWITKIATEAKKRNKTLLAFSHYPMCDFNDGASEAIAAFMGPKKWQLSRVPSKEMADALAASGLKIHFGGHMHINDTGIHEAAGNVLVNVQTPSLAAYIPAYKIATLRPNEIIEVETVALKNVARVQELVPLYEMEYEHLKKEHPERIWDKTILKTNSYLDFTDSHLKELVRLRFLPEDWPEGFGAFLKQKIASELAVMAQLQGNENLENVTTKRKKEILKQDIFKKSNFKNWTGADLINDFYRIRSGDGLAEKYIGRERIQSYKILAALFSVEQPNEDLKQKQCRLFFTILKKFLEGAPADHFLVDLKTGTVNAIEGK